MKHIVFFDPLSETAVCVKYAFSPGHETRLLHVEFDRSKICIIFFSRWTKLVSINMKLRNVSHNRSLSQSMSAVPAFLLFLWQSICWVVRGLKSCHRVILPSQLSRKYCMKKKKKRDVHFLHLVNFKEFCPSYISYYSVSRGGEFVKIGFQVLAFLTSRDRAPFCPGFVLVIYLLWMFHDKKLTPLWSVFSCPAVKVQSSNH